MKKRILKTIVATCMTAMMFVGCASNNTTNEDKTTENTVTVTDVRGEVEIPANPKRIVDLSGNSDILSILGYKVVGTANSDAYDYTKFPSYLEETLSGAKILGYSMQDTMDVEAVMNLNPDLIVISTVQEKMYDALSEIAPTVMIQLEALNWKDDVRALGKVFGKEDVANEWIANYEAKAKDAGDKIKAKVIKLKNEDNYVVLSRLEYEKETTLASLEELFNTKSEFDVVIKDSKEKGLVAYYNGVRIFIPASQIDTKYVEDKQSLVGKTLTVRLIDFSRENLSKIVASRKVILEETKAKKEAEAWETLHEGDVVKAEIKRFTKFGAFAEINGIDGLIHLSQISWKHINSCDEVLKIGEIVDVKILNLSKDEKKLSLSIKALTPEPWSIVDQKYAVNSAVLGKVVRINDFGAFVELEPGIDGLVHISKISHDHIKHPSEVLSIGEEVKCIILSIDKENKRIALSIKDAQ